MTAERRLPLALGASLLVNAAAWTAVGAAAAYRVVAPPPTLEFQRVIVTKEGKKTVKAVRPEEVKKKVEKIVEERRPTPPKPVEHPIEPKPAPKSAPPPPQGAHNKVLAAKPSAKAPSKPDFTALTGGNAAQGKPTDAQAPGTATTNPPDPPKTEPPKADPPKTEPPKTAPPAADPGPKSEPPKADLPKGEPLKADPPKKKGPTRDAQHSNEVNPSIPDDLKTQEFKKFVRLRVEIAADGSFTVTLRTSSGNDEVDRRVLDALKQWTWKPKLVDGEPVDSTQLFRFDFEVK